MTLTQDWTPEHYLKHITDNNLDNIWTGWCNPKSVEGIRVAAYTPLYNDQHISALEKPCSKKSCKGGTYRYSLDDKKNRILNWRTCDVCNAKISSLYRWTSRYDKTKIWFNSPEIVRRYAQQGRSFYGTLTLYKKEIISPRSQYSNENITLAHTLGIDIDIDKGNICDKENRKELDKALEVIRDELSTFAPKSYNLQTSGNGVYVFLHHKLCTTDIRNTMYIFNRWINSLQDKCEKLGMKGIELDAINVLSRVYKLVGSIHQQHDLVAIPLEHDIKLESMDSNEFKLKDFNMSKYYVDNKINFYNRLDVNEKGSLYKFLDEFTVNSDLRNDKLYQNYMKETGKIAIEAITGENQNIDFAKMKESLTLSDEEYFKKYGGWKKIDMGNNSSVRYKRKIDGRIITQLIGVKNSDYEKVIQKIWNDING